MTTEVARTILSQLGNGRFRAMTGAKDFLGSKDTLSFSLPGGAGFCKDGINRAAITLNASDTYDMKFYRLRKGRPLVTVAAHEGVYNDQLQAVFKDVTGLDTHL